MVYLKLEQPAGFKIQLNLYIIHPNEKQPVGCNKLNSNGYSFHLLFWVFFNPKQVAITFMIYYNAYSHTKKIWKQINRHNLYKSLNTALHQGSEESETTWKPIFLGRHSFHITSKMFIFKSTFSNQLLKLNWESGINFSSGTF